MIEIAGLNILILSLTIYFIGSFIAQKITILDRFHIPVGVIGGIPAAIVFFLIEEYSDLTFQFDTQLRDFFLLFFFCTTGMLANLSELLQGGRLLVKLTATVFVFLIMQNTIGVIAASILGTDLVNGLVVGSISLAGGHGTAISWGAHLDSLGYPEALDIGLISATLGLIAGAFVGGMVSGSIINKKSLHTINTNKTPATTDYSEIERKKLFKIYSSTPLLLKTILFILFTMFIGRELNKVLAMYGIISPDYLPTMILAIFFVTIGNRFTESFVDHTKISLLNNASLQIFIAMTIMSIDAKMLFHYKILEVVFIMLLQIIFIVIFARYVFFKVAGRNYDSATLTAGFIGCGLGATPVGLANMETITNKYGPSFKAFLLLPLLGSIFTDLVNAVIINFFLHLLA